jgi:hypothetical protein
MARATVRRPAVFVPSAAGVETAGDITRPDVIESECVGTGVFLVSRGNGAERGGEPPSKLITVPVLSARARSFGFTSGLQPEKRSGDAFAPPDSSPIAKSD